MIRSTVVLFLLLSLSLSASYARSSSTHSHHSTTKVYKPKKVKEPKVRSGPVHVKDYNRRDGTHVSGYDRAAPNTSGGSTPLPYSGPAEYKRPAPTTASTPLQPYKAGHLAKGFTLSPTVHTGWFGKIKRSGAAKNAFKREHPCPSNGNASGSCPGYVIDHVSPLECGGADDPSNMQWQTVADGKAKDKTERYCR